MSLNHEQSIRESFKMISYLLQYPDNRWMQWKELVEEAEGMEDSVVKDSILSFLNKIGHISLDDLAQEYVNLFDFNQSCTLSLSYLKAGEQRERGQILLELKELYKEYGYEMTDEELSDYLPVVLEFASVAPIEIALNLLKSLVEPIEQLRSELDAHNSVYSLLIEATLLGLEALETTIKERG